MTKKLAMMITLVLTVLFVASLSKTYLVEDWVEKQNTKRMERINKAYEQSGHNY